MDDSAFTDFMKKIENAAEPTEYLKEMFRAHGQKGKAMIHEGERLDKEIKRLEQELEAPISGKRRMEINQAIIHLKSKKASWMRPKARA